MAKDMICREEFDSAKEGIYRTIDSKVSWVVFWSIVLLMATIVGAMWWLLYTEVRTVGTAVGNTSGKVIEISTILKQAEITK